MFRAVNCHAGSFRPRLLRQWISAEARFNTGAADRPGLMEHYRKLVRHGVLQPDEHQQTVVEALGNLLQHMAPYNKDMEIYHARLHDWETKRNQLREQLLREEGEREVKRQLDKKLAEQGRRSVIKWISRWYDGLRQKLSFREEEKQKRWHSDVYGQEAAKLLRQRRLNRAVEPGAGRMVANINREKKLDRLVGPRPALPSSPKGLYIYGSVGCGKTMLMDMFYNAAEGIVKNRRRVHFHGALLEVHDLMHKLWKSQKDKEASIGTTDFDSDIMYESAETEVEPLIEKWVNAEKKFLEENQRGNLLDLVADKLLGQNIGGGASLLCFDEMQVVDVFTAVALAGIFSRLIKKGSIIVATSNRAPNDLNQEGMQKEIFDKFILELQQHCELMLVGSYKDYRRMLSKENNGKIVYKNYFWPITIDTKNTLEQKWQEMVSQSGETVVSSTIPVMFGRNLEVPQSCNGIAKFTFDEICDKPVGAADYIALAQNFHTVFVTDIPVMSMRNRDKARRFITLVDELYNHRRQMICTAAASIDELFLGSEEGCLVDLESLQFETEAEDTRLRRDVTLSGSVSPLAGTKEDRSRIQFIYSGSEELFAFQRAVSRLIEMQSSLYLQAVDSSSHSNSNKSMNQVAES